MRTFFEMILALGIFVFFLLLVIGLIYPKLTKQENRKSVMKKFLTPLVSIFIIFSIIVEPPKDVEQSNEKTQSLGIAQIEDKPKEEPEEIELIEPTFDFKSEINHDDQQLVVESNTNLPDDTVVAIEIDGLNEKIVQESKVVDGKLLFAPIALNQLKNGSVAITPLIKDSPKSEKFSIAALSTSNIKNADVEVKRGPIDVKTQAVMVNRVVDGDTIEVTINGNTEKVRLILVDTPETVHPQKPVQPFGPEASDFAKKHLEGQQIFLELGVQERDKYGRLLGYVWLGDKLFNKMLLEEGLARVSVFPPNTKYIDDFKVVEKSAKDAKKGIWSLEDYSNVAAAKPVEKPKQPAANTQQAKPKQPAAQQAKPSQPATNNAAQAQAKPKQPATPAPSTDAKKECNIKGSVNGIYHTTSSRSYSRTKNVVQWFCSEEEAKKAGYRAPKN